MENITIMVLHPDQPNSSILVKADSKRFGKNEIMFEGISFKECFEYVKRETKRDHLRLMGCLVGAYTDCKGKTFPWIMDVL